MKRSYLLPSNLLYTRDHTWVKMVGEEAAVIGVTDYAFEEATGLGSRTILHIELPEVGKRVGQKDALATIETEKNVSEIPSPLSGEVTEVNEKLLDEPSLVGSDPYGQGWIVKLRIAERAQTKGLMNCEQYSELVKSLS
ncbi:MAG: glycine cleavage system protein GcvH [Candidatus Bathyarchaeia archaeon]